MDETRRDDGDGDPMKKSNICPPPMHGVKGVVVVVVVAAAVRYNRVELVYREEKGFFLMSPDDDGDGDSDAKGIKGREY